MPSINLAKLDFVSIRLVVLCAQMGSLSMAAQMANMSVSRASHRLSSLEAKLGMQLFVRDHRGLRVTKSGSVFAGHGRVILDEVNQLGEQLHVIDRGESATCR